MALVLKPFTVTVTAIDGGLATGRHIVHLPSDTDLVAAVNFTGQYAALVADILDTAVVSATLGVPLYEDTYPDAPVTADVEDKAVFLMLAAGDSRSALAMPGVDDGVLIPAGEPGGGVELDFSNAAVEDLADALVDGLLVQDSGGNPVTVEPCDNRGADYVSVRTAYKQNRASHRRSVRRG